MSARKGIVINPSQLIYCPEQGIPFVHTLNFLHRGNFLQSVMVTGNKHANKRHWQYILVNRLVTQVKCDAKKNDERVHENTLIPAEYTWYETHPLLKNKLPTVAISAANNVMSKGLFTIFFRPFHHFDEVI